MILKIRRENAYEAWWILDDIRKISVGKTLSKSYQETESLINTGKPAVDILLLDKFFNCQANNVRSDNDRYNSTELICRRADDTEFCIWFDTEAFLCNDKGQTIDRIVV
jgi:hypothetical protein